MYKDISEGETIVWIYMSFVDFLMRYLRLSEPVTMPVVVDVAVVVVEDEVVVEPVFIVGMTAADSFSFSLSALSSDQYLFTQNKKLA